MYLTPTVLDTLLIDGADLNAQNGIVVNHIDYFAPAKRRGSDDVVPRRHGQIGYAKPLDAYSFSVHVTVLSENNDGSQAATENLRRVNMVANLRALVKALSKNGGLVTINRQLQSSEGTYGTTTCQGEFVGTNAFELLNYQNGSTELEFVNLDGCWRDTGYTSISAASGTTGVSITGDFTTRVIKLTFPGAGTLTNTTLGISTTVTQASVLDVELYTATAGLSTMSHAGSDAWFEIRPGSSNQINWSGTGTVTVQFKAQWM